LTHIDDIKNWLETHSKADENAQATHSNASPDRVEHRIAVPKMRAYLKVWVDDNKDTLTYDDWVKLLDALYHGQSLEERIMTGMLLSHFGDFRRRLSLSQLGVWLGQLDGWKEVDYTCQSVFVADEMLANWTAWDAFLCGLVRDDNVNKRRAGIVLLVRPVREHDDVRFVTLLLAQVELLKHEKDKRITKAISWGLREAVKHNHTLIQDYVDVNADTLPAIAVRETRKKLTTGKK